MLRRLRNPMRCAVTLGCRIDCSAFRVGQIVKLSSDEDRGRWRVMRIGDTLDLREAYPWEVVWQWIKGRWA